MPMHDWTRVPSGLFHDFHQTWSICIKKALNKGLLPEGYSALVEQRSGSIESDVLAIEEQRPLVEDDVEHGGGTAVVEKPRTRIIRQSDRDFFADKANRVVIRHRLGKVVAFIEIVSPGNKDTAHAISQFVNKINDAIHQGLHVLVIDLFPPGKRDPQGLHQLIWEDMEEDEDVVLPEKENRLLASYESASVYTAYLETVGVGSALPDMPLFIAPGAHVVVPMEACYQEAWQDTPAAVRRLVANP